MLIVRHYAAAAMVITAFFSVIFTLNVYDRVLIKGQDDLSPFFALLIMASFPALACFLIGRAVAAFLYVGEGCIGYRRFCLYALSGALVIVFVEAHVGPSFSRWYATHQGLIFVASAQGFSLGLRFRLFQP